jgi:6-pyruvoyltetrahydropterin/6-carboxytetrahydropterin synthase
MFELSVQGTFSAAHQVKGYHGDCAGIHGHTYRIDVKVGVKKLNKLGMTMDFRRVKKELDRVLKKLDHKNLNKIVFFKRHNATAEWVAVYIYQGMKKKIKAIDSVTVWEGPHSCVTYYENDE